MKISNMFLSMAGAALVAAAAMPGVASAAVDGAKVFHKCQACHSIEAGVNKVGPSLHGVVGRKAGTAAGYNRYKGMKGADWTWNEDNLFTYLANPSKFTKARTGHRSAMGFHLKNKEQRKAVIEFLKQHS